MDDDFSDDGFDVLDDDALRELENNAIQFTQAQKAPTSQESEPFNNYGYEDDDLDDTVVIDEAAQLPIRHSVERQLPVPGPRPAASIQFQQQPQQRWNQPPARPNPPHAAVHPRYPPPSVVARPPFQSSSATPRPPPSPALAGRHVPPPTTSQFMRPPPLPSSYRPQFQQSQASQRVVNNKNNNKNIPQSQTENDILAALQARVQSLEAELTSTKGEVAIVRSKYDQSVATHETEVAKLKKQNQDALAKQERVAEAALHAEKKAATELQFTKQDLKDELQKARKGRRNSDVNTTPKKGRAAGWNNLADGFDDNEVLPSPSKGQGGPRSKGKNAAGGIIAQGERTPSKAKRKRPAVESPVSALEVEYDVAMTDAGAIPAAELAGANFRPNMLPYDFLRLVLDHSAFHDRPLTFDLFARYSFPSDPNQSFASIIFQKLPSLGDPHDPMRLLVQFCELVIDIWNQCLQEKYHEPIYDLVALVTFVLHLNTISVAPFIISTLIPVAQTTLDLVGVPRFESPDGDLSNHPDPTVQQLYMDIDNEGTLQVMYLAALGCTDAFLLDPQQPLYLGPDSDPPQALFWKLMRPDFVLMMLSPKQQPDDFLGMLSLLCTSCMTETIGPITGDPNKHPVLIARTLIDRISLYMYETPRWASNGGSSVAFSHRQCIVRLAALKTLMAFAQSPFGAVQLALSDVAIPRLVAVLCGAIDALYDMDVPVSLLFDKDLSSEADVPKKEKSTSAEPEKAPVVVDLTEDGPGAAVPEKETPSSPEDDAEASYRPSTAEDAVRDSTPLIHTIISSTTLLLYTLITDPVTSSHANISAKLGPTHGGSQRYQITLARLSFAEEDLVLEAGIDTGTVDRAHELLELFVTPDEGEGVSEVFGI